MRHRWRDLHPQAGFLSSTQDKSLSRFGFSVHREWTRARLQPEHPGHSNKEQTPQSVRRESYVHPARPVPIHECRACSTRLIRHTRIELLAMRCGMDQTKRQSMRCLIYVLISFLLVVVAAGECRAGQADAAELAKLIDQQIDAHLSKEGVRAAALADDAEFVRRIFLDLHGTVPTLEQVRRFLADTAPDKRARLIDSML